MSCYEFSWTCNIGQWMEHFSYRHRISTSLRKTKITCIYLDCWANYLHQWHGISVTLFFSFHIPMQMPWLVQPEIILFLSLKRKNKQTFICSDPVMISVVFLSHKNYLNIQPICYLHKLVVSIIITNKIFFPARWIASKWLIGQCYL